MLCSLTQALKPCEWCTWQCLALSAPACSRHCNSNFRCIVTRGRWTHGPALLMLIPGKKIHKKWPEKNFSRLMHLQVNVDLYRSCLLWDYLKNIIKNLYKQTNKTNPFLTMNMSYWSSHTSASIISVKCFTCINRGQDSHKNHLHSLFKWAMQSLAALGLKEKNICCCCSPAWMSRWFWWAFCISQGHCASISISGHYPG